MQTSGFRPERAWVRSSCSAAGRLGSADRGTPTGAKLSDGALRTLTPRQQDVLALMAEGRSNARIAAELFLTEKAVVQHSSRIYDALDLPIDADSHRRCSR